MKPEEITAASYLFDRESGFELSPEAEEMLAETGLSDMTGEQVAEMIRTHILSSPDLPEPERTAAYWTLGKKYDNGYLDFFKRQLQLELSREEPSTVFQLLVVMDDIGEQVFADDRLYSKNIDEKDLNFRDARNYLARQ